MSIMASSDCDNDNKLKKVDKKSKKAIKKSKLKGNQEHINPMAIEKDMAKQKKKKFKKKGKKKSSVTSSEKGANDQNKQVTEKASDKLLEIKLANKDYSSNWKNLLKSLPKEEATDVTNHPAFVRRNKKGQLITNQKMNHPKAILVGNKDKDKKQDKSKDKVKSSADPEGDEVWFDDVDPVLLDMAKSKDPEEALVKNNSFKGVTKILGMDCEMVGVGTDGVDSILARVSIVNHFGNPLYDKFVAPREKVTDYRTAVSGVRPEDLLEAPEFKDVQAEVAEMIKDRVLVGHAIHHDLKVLFLDHPKKLIRDTSKYKPFKAAFGGRTPGLKALSERFLGVKVQSGEHSSIQDSQAAVRLYTMFRKDWEAAREAKRSANNRFKKKASKKATTNVDKLEPSRLEKTKEASKSIGSRNLYCPSDSDED